MTEPAEKLTPTQRLEQRAREQHAQIMAALTKPTFEASEKITVGRDSRGYHYDVAGVTGEGESLDEVAARVLDIAYEFDRRLSFEPDAPEVDISRNAKGDIQFTVSGAPDQARALAEELHTTYDLSRAQHFGRDYLPNEKDAVKRAKT